MSGEVTISLVVPTYNMSPNLERLLASLEESKFENLLEEIIIVDDASTDTTANFLRSLKTKNSLFTNKIKIITSEKNQGRHLSRILGARAASSPLVLFLDAQVTVSEVFGEVLRRTSEKFSNVLGRTAVDPRNNIYGLYSSRTHRAVFTSHYEKMTGLVAITAANIRTHLKGTSIFLCDRAHFLEVCENFKSGNTFNDDFQIINLMMRKKSVVIAPDLMAVWTPRENTKDFLLRLWKRGTAFAEYSVLQKHQFFTFAFLLSALGFGFWIKALFTKPFFALEIVLLIFFFMGLSTFLLSNKPREAFKLMPLHIASLLTFTLGMLRGLKPTKQ